MVFDVGGERFQCSRKNILKYPNTRLGKLVSSDNIEEILQLCDEYNPGHPPEYFFDRNPENFPSVLEMYRSGKFHIPDAAKCSLRRLDNARVLMIMIFPSLCHGHEEGLDLLGP